MMTKLDMLKMLKAKVCECQKCPELVANRTQIVFDNINYEEDNQLVKSGNPNAEIVFIGESPGENEDLQGVPFVGQSGKLLNNILKAYGFTREQVYVCNVIKCRPPRNRVPKEDEANNCRPYLDLQLKIIKPRLIVCLGNVAAQNLLGINTSVSYLRGQILEYNEAKVICTFHPSYLLHNPDEKAKVAEDMQFILRTLRGE